MKINKNLIKEYPWKTTWIRRTKTIAEIIIPECSVIDLGGGFCNLFRRLKKCKKYASIDIKKWTNITVVADFNKGEFPTIGKFDYVVCQGILEYIDDPEEFLKKIKKYGDTMIATYWFGGHRDGSKSSNMDINKFKKTIDSSGWKILLGTSVSRRQKLFYCTKI